MMPVHVVIALIVAGFTSSWWLTGCLLNYARARAVIDVPNERSSHAAATPRGGGMSIVFTAVPMFALLVPAGILSGMTAAGVGGAGALVAAIGFGDDHTPIAARWRLVGHFAAAGWLLFCLGPLPIGGAAPALWYAVAGVYVVWTLNLTNFMDGIDGLAATEAISVGVGAAFCAWLVAAPAAAWAPPLILAAACGGFLVWNWPPARIFMGDGGSGFIGLQFAALSLVAATTTSRLFWCWLILLAVFVSDSTVTLARRTLRREPVWTPHRLHAYQRLARRCGAHRPVTLMVAAINVGVLLPLATLVALGVLPGPVGGIVAYVLAVLAVAALGAGRPDALPPAAAPGHV